MRATFVPASPSKARTVLCVSRYAITGGYRYYSSEAKKPTRITLVGGGTIGASLAALHLEKAFRSRPVKLTIYDNKQDLEGYLRKSISLYLQNSFKSGDGDTSGLSKAADYFDRCLEDGTIEIGNSLASAVSSADIVEEQGPEVLDFKKKIWPDIERHAPSTHFTLYFHMLSCLILERILLLIT